MGFESKLSVTRAPMILADLDNHAVDHDPTNEDLLNIG